MKALLALGLVLIVAALAAAGVFMLRRPGAESGIRAKSASQKRMARALAVRVGLSIGLFLLVLFSYWMGWIQPTGIPLKSS